MSRRSALWGAAALTVLLVLLVGGAMVSPALGGDDHDSSPTQVVSNGSTVDELVDPNTVVVEDAGWYESDEDDIHDDDDHKSNDHESREHDDDEHDDDD
jgi:hypothetical protein